jgi:GT2 family glycosyltransferase
MIHILTLTWNGLDKLQRLSDGLVRNVVKLGMPAMWYVRDNGSIDGTKEWIESFDDSLLNIVPLYAGHNRANFAMGVNSLANLAKENFTTKGNGSEIYPQQFLLLNNDIVFEDDWSLKRMHDLYYRDPVIHMVGARMLYTGTNKLQHGGVIFGPRYGKMPYHYRHKQVSDKKDMQDRYFQAVTAACCLLNAESFFEVGGMCEDLHWAFEDIDLCLKFGQKKYKIAYCGKTEISHEESASLKKNPINKMFLQKNVKYFKDKWFGKYDLDHEKYLSNSSYKLV